MESFDTILSTHVIECAPNPRKAMIESSRILKSGGILIMTTPMGVGYGLENDYWRFTEPGLRLLCEENGFEVTYVKPLGGLFRSIGAQVSNHVYYYYGYRKFIIQFLLTKLICAIIQIFFHTLDKFHPAYENTPAYIVVAQKK
jgi:ubiquinone/menaquinone biosynthesis C-methylase UbiE